MNAARTLSREAGAIPMASAVPIVFIVDDDISVRESLELLVRDENWKPVIFASAQEFLDHPRKHVPSCLVLDVSLPGLDGLELQKRLAVEHVDVPIIFINICPGEVDVSMPSEIDRKAAPSAPIRTKIWRTSWSACDSRSSFQTTTMSSLRS